VSLPPKLCPECGEEYLHTAERCVHCDVALVQPDQVETTETPDLPPIGELTCVRAASVGWATSLSDRLREAGIPHRIEAVGGEGMGSAQRPGHQVPYGVYVQNEDFAAAAEIDRIHMASQIPDIPDDFEEGAELGDDACPACGEPLPPDAPECAGCGLVLG
jgi:hypothetical protein